MPMLDVDIPEGALLPAAETTLIDELTTILLRAEGADPDNKYIRDIAWVFLHRPAVYVGGSPAAAPHYRVIARVPEGQLNGADKKSQLIAEITQAFAAAEGRDSADVRNRVWVFPLEIPEGSWGAAGIAVGLSDILAAAVGDVEKARTVAAHRIAESRQERGITI